METDFQNIMTYYCVTYYLHETSEFMGKTCQAAQLTHYVLGIVLHTRGPWKFSLADIKKIFCTSDLKRFPHKFTYVRQNEIQGSNMVFFNAHAYSILFCLTWSIRQ